MGSPQDDTELYKQFSDNDSFRRWLMDTVFALTYQEAA
jgi:type I restriction enzyme R subunit